MKQVNERDANGWRIPRKGTLSRKIYNAIQRGQRPADIARRLRIDVGKVNVLVHRFRNPEWASNRRQAALAVDAPEADNA